MRIILIRHGESEGNLNTAAYTTTPDHRIPLTPAGVRQARAAGRRIRRLLEGGGGGGWKVYFYVSPYERTRSTLREIGRAFPRERVREIGNFQVQDRMRVVMEDRLRFGRFFFRFPDGESAADVYDRVSSFMETLWRDIDMKRLNQDSSSAMNMVIVTHGLTSRVFLMKWFEWTVDQFECLNNLENCEFLVLQLGPGGEYSLAIHHSKEELKQWGLSEEMIADQQWCATACRGSWNEEHSWYLNRFFDGFKEGSSLDSESEQDGDDGS